MARVQCYQHVRRRRHAKERAPFCRGRHPFENARRSAEVAIDLNVLSAQMAVFGDHIPLKNARATYPILL
jgi:hypothetical protein